MTFPDLLASVSSAWAPPSDEPSWQWMERNVVLDNSSAQPGPYSTRLMPFVQIDYEFSQDQRVRRLVKMVSRQSAKTQNAINFLLWCIDQDPGPTAWFMAAASNCRGFVRKRLDPAINNCSVVLTKTPDHREKRTASLIRFDTMPLTLSGANSRVSLQSDPLRRVICDERNEWKPGRIDILRKTMRTFYNSIEISMGTPRKKDDELHRDWLAGSQTFIHWNCPKCGHSQPFRFGQEKSVMYPLARKKGGFRWNTNEVTRPDGIHWNFEEVRKTVRYECENETCDAEFRNHQKLDLLQSWHPFHRNPDALPKYPSIHWWAAYMPWEECDWANIVEEFLRANHARKSENGGDWLPLMAFVNDTLGEPWEELRGEMPPEGAIMNRCGEYQRGEMWPADPATITQIITVDVQWAHLVIARRQHKRGQGSRLIEAKKLLDFGELAKYQRDNGVKDRCVWIDCGDENQKVFRACLDNGRWVRSRDGNMIWDGWTPLLGDDALEFTVDGAKQFWKMVIIDPAVGTSRQGTLRLPRYSWCSLHYKEKLYIYAINGQGQPWEIYKNIEPEYIKQMQATERRQILDAAGKICAVEFHEKGRHDYGDTEIFQLVVSDVAGISKGRT